MQSRQTKHSNKVGALLVFLAIFWPAATVGTAPARSARDCPHPHGTGLPFRRLLIPERARLGLGILLRLLTLGTAFTGQLLQFDQLDLNTPQTSGMTTPPQLCMREPEQASCGPAMVA